MPHSFQEMAKQLLTQAGGNLELAIDYVSKVHDMTNGVQQHHSAVVRTSSQGRNLF